MSINNLVNKLHETYGIKKHIIKHDIKEQCTIINKMCQLSDCEFKVRYIIKILETKYKK